MTNQSKHKILRSSIIILNYFGEYVIEETVNSVLKNNLIDSEIIIVDNASTDNSRKIINKLVSKNKSIIKTVYLDKNLGFAGGNNKAISIAKGKFIILLNNDCVVNKNWLSELIKTAESDKSIFSVTSKILLYPKYFNFSLPVTEGFLLHKIFLNFSHLTKYNKDKSIELPFKYLINNYELDIPFDQKYDKLITLEFIFKKSSRTFINPFRDSKIFKSLSIKKTSKNFYSIKCILDTTQLKNTYHKVQNFGSFPFQDGYCRDIGAEVTYQSQNYEQNLGQYNNEKDVYASCGAACLFRKDILDKIGYLDESFFMYYEDIEISERGRLAGYKIVACPTAIAHHLHAISSHEWSPFFIYHVEKGRLMHVFYHYPISVFYKEIIKLFFISILRLLRDIKNRKSILISLQYFYTIVFYFINIFKLYKKRDSLNQFNYSKDSIKNNYNKIIEGFWYFN